MPESGEGMRFAALRGVRWRIELGILPRDSSIDDLRRATADRRRRYATLRRTLLVDPHVSQYKATSIDLIVDNPLSQNPDSSWGRFFRNAELEKTVDQDLSRLYPEQDSYFQTPGCQGMLRRILLLWCLSHQHYGYGQGMHELLAPLLYVLHVDLQRLYKVRTQYKEHFNDKFDSLSHYENDATYNFDYKKFLIDNPGSNDNDLRCRTLDQLDPEVQSIASLIDAYGAEGELGIVISEKFMEHDAYSMFDSLMSGDNGEVAMAEFFNPVPSPVSLSGLPFIIETSSAIYHLLSVIDCSLHSHLVELGVEPQYFALRWLRVLFGREFFLEDLLLIWDEVFKADNSRIDREISCLFSVVSSSRGGLILGIAVSMILHMRSSLLATENATICLQRLLNFPDNFELPKLISKAKSFQALALKPSTFSSVIFLGDYDYSKAAVAKHRSLSLDSPLCVTPLSDNYWEDKWRVAQLPESGNQTGTQRRRWSEKTDSKPHIARTESDPSQTKPKSSVRRSLLEDLTRHLGDDVESGEENSSVFSEANSSLSGGQDSEKSSVASNMGDEAVQVDDAVPVSVLPNDAVSDVESCNGKNVKERKLLHSKLQWFWKFGRKSAGEGVSETPTEPEETARDDGKNAGSSSDGENCDSFVVGKRDTLRSLGQSMLEHIQIVESVFQQDLTQIGSLENLSKNGLVGSTAITALKELRKISNLLSQM